jgi:methyltransferase (TIGR00027 family)
VASLLAQDLGTRIPLPLNRTLVSYVRGRTQFFDAQVAQATAGGPAQVVIIGAGYDDRAFRFRAPGVRFVEVDLPATQEDKRSRLAKLGVDTHDISFVAVDLETDALDTELAAALDPTHPTTILCEAVVPYLRRPRAAALLGALGRSPGSWVRLAVDLPVRPRALASRVAFGILRAGAAVVGEPIRTVLETGEVTSMLKSAGWVERERVSGSDLEMSAGGAETLFLVADDRTRTR